MNGRTDISDREALEMLRLRAAGLSFGRIAQQLGRSRNAWIALADRIRKADEAAHGHAGPAAGDGSMGPGWIEAGLRAQEAQA